MVVQNEIWDFFEIHLTANATSIYNQNKFQKKQIGYYDVFGRKIKTRNNSVLFKLFDDGSVEKENYHTIVLSKIIYQLNKKIFSSN